MTAVKSVDTAFAFSRQDGPPGRPTPAQSWHDAVNRKVIALFLTETTPLVLDVQFAAVQIRLHSVTDEYEFDVRCDALRVTTTSSHVHFGGCQLDALALAHCCASEAVSHLAVYPSFPAAVSGSSS